jgi:hypothetical protein
MFEYESLDRILVNVSIPLKSFDLKDSMTTRNETLVELNINNCVNKLLQ